MPDSQQPMSNRQRKIMERQAERNREMAALKQAQTRTPFREAELQFLSRHPPPDYSKALNFRQPAEILLQDNKIKRVLLKKQMGQYSNLFGVKEDQSMDADSLEYAYLHDDHPVPNSGLWDLHEDVYTGKRSLNDHYVYVQRKATTDEHASGYGSEDDNVDSADNNGSRAGVADQNENENKNRNRDRNGQGSECEDPQSGNKSNINNINNSNDQVEKLNDIQHFKSRGKTKSKQSQPSVRTLVPIIDGTPSVPEDMTKDDPEPSAQVPILPPGQLVRKMRWVTLGYQYHWPSKTYHFDQSAPFPSELCTLSKAVVEAIDGVSPYPYSATDFVAEAGVINYYQLKDRLMGHVDRSELNKDAPLDEMGMGKTIQMISLLLSESGKPNLIVAPTVAILQWVSEITNHAPSLKALVFHGPNRTESMKELLSHDVVVTTYSIIESAFRKQKYGFRRGNTTVKEYSLLHRIKWYRIILDEAHNIKERSCNTARSAFALEADRKWCLSGTPMQNRVGELYSLIRFMQADPYGYYFCKKCSCKSLHWKYSNMKDCDDCGHRPMDHVCWWNNEILKPIQTFAAEGSGEEAFAKLRKLLDRIMLRRTKVERADDLGLPPRKMIVSRYLFNEEEEDLYESLFSDTKRKFSTYVEQGTVLNNYANIFELLTKMRQMVDHPDLVLKKVKPGDVGLPETLVCCICQEEAEDPIVSKCHHLFCREDAEQYITSSAVEAPECPVCHIPLSIDLQQPTYMKEEPDYEAEVKHRNFARTSIVNRINMDTWRSSTKIEALVEQLYNLQRQDRSTKSICFSQYVTFLDLIKWRLEKAGFKCVKLDGHMTPAQRDASIRKFSDDPTVTVFLISLKAGGVALNLTAASRVFICDPWWNPAAELQAMDRIHRIGQYRPILITRLIIENSIESRILQLQEKKQAMVDSTIGKDPAALARLTPEDLRFLFVN
ncbi:DNA repair protein rad16 [Lobosporangium transversale]|nr:DNA repair protein rad16 [Lobosporangium transversale]